MTLVTGHRTRRPTDTASCQFNELGPTFLGKSGWTPSWVRRYSTSDMVRGEVLCSMSEDEDEMRDERDN